MLTRPPARTERRCHEHHLHHLQADLPLDLARTSVCGPDPVLLAYPSPEEEEEEEEEEEYLGFIPQTPLADTQPRP